MGDHKLSLQNRPQLRKTALTGGLRSGRFGGSWWAFEAMASHVLVMQAGRVGEEGDHERIFRRPEHAYTRELLAAVPVPGGRRGRSSA